MPVHVAVDQRVLAPLDGVAEIHRALVAVRAVEHRSRLADVSRDVADLVSVADVTVGASFVPVSVKFTVSVAVSPKRSVAVIV